MTEKAINVVFDGHSTYWVGKMKIERGNVFLRAFPSFRWSLALGNVKDLMKNYSEKTVYDLKRGKLESKKIRVYPFDLSDYSTDHATMNNDFMREMESLKAERNYLYGFVQRMQELLQSTDSLDLLKSKFKDDYQYFTGLTPQYLFNKKDK